MVIDVWCKSNAVIQGVNARELSRRQGGLGQCKERRAGPVRWGPRETEVQGGVWVELTYVRFIEEPETGCGQGVGGDR